MVLLMMMSLIMRTEDDAEHEPAKLVHRERRPWTTYIKPMLDDKSFRQRFRMTHEEFIDLVEMLRPTLQRDEKMGALRNGAIPVEFQVAITLRFLAGASIFEAMVGHVIARSSAYMVVYRVVDALNACNSLRCVWPTGEEAKKQGKLYKELSTNNVIERAVGAMDGLFLRIIKPKLRSHKFSNIFYSGHKKGFGMNLQVRKGGANVCACCSSCCC